ncbi:CHAP domain-containing protein [Pseudanabaena sp. 'Roaring Creek']|uniref:CHAP domain-containing protein n=1 Tax=Pseudanabaena sp. 'Roaring Creek' TaxID=1681830 RepID=UPI0006D77CB3|nr:CHAP domain-containing protein [Pseudanabaena sp. 'Roaring Creek']
MIKQLIATSLSLAVTSLSSLAIPSASYADQYCQCVGYVKNVLGISQAMGNAKDMIYSLPKKGFHEVRTPVPGAIVVMQPSFPGADRTYGHVGFVDSFDSRTGKIVVRGANQGGKTYRDAGCSNVAAVGFRTPVVNRNDVSFWVR